MERERAIEILERKSTIPMDGETFDEICMAFDIAISDVRKQIAEKPIWINGRNCCPLCKEPIYSDCGNEQYCDCGQKLDW